MTHLNSSLRKTPKYSPPVADNPDKLVDKKISLKDISSPTIFVNELTTAGEAFLTEPEPSSDHKLMREVVETILERDFSRLEKDSLKEVKPDSMKHSSTIKKLESHHDESHSRDPSDATMLLPRVKKLESNRDESPPKVSSDRMMLLSRRKDVESHHDETHSRDPSNPTMLSSEVKKLESNRDKSPSKFSSDPLLLSSGVKEIESNHDDKFHSNPLMLLPAIKKRESNRDESPPSDPTMLSSGVKNCESNCDENPAKFPSDPKMLSSRIKRSESKYSESSSEFPSDPKMLTSGVKKHESNCDKSPLKYPYIAMHSNVTKYPQFKAEEERLISSSKKIKPVMNPLNGEEERKGNFYPYLDDNPHKGYGESFHKMKSSGSSSKAIMTTPQKEMAKLMSLNVSYKGAKPSKETEMVIENEGGLGGNKVPHVKFQLNDIQDKEKKAKQVKIKTDLALEEDKKKASLKMVPFADFDIPLTETVIIEDFDIDALRDEIKNYLPCLEEEMKRIIQDTDRMAKGHSAKMNLAAELRVQSEKTTGQIKKEISCLLDEAIPKLDSVQKKLSDSKKSKNDLEKQKKELEEMEKNKPSHAAQIKKSLERTSGLLVTYTKEIEDLGSLRKSVQEKIKKSKESLKDQIQKTLQFYDNIIERARSALEKAALTAVKIDEKKAQSVDLCFVLDCTNSMGEFIHLVMDNVHEIIRALKLRFGGFSIRIGVLGYRDVHDRNRFETLNFTDNVDEVKNFLASIKVEGGDDLAEDVNGAFQQMLKLKWESSTRVVIHIADAPCHGREFHNLEHYAPHLKDRDYYLNYKYKGDKSYDIIFEDFKRKMLNYIFFGVDSVTDKMFDKFQSIYKRCGEKKCDLLFTQERIGRNAAAHFIQVVTHYISTSVSTSIKQTFKPLKNSIMPIKEKEVEVLLEADKEDDIQAVAPVRPGEDKKSYERFLILFEEVQPLQPKWESEKFFNEEIHAKIYYLYNENRLKNLIEGKVTFSKETASMMINTRPFAKGGYNLAYYCKAMPQISKQYYKMVLKKPMGRFEKAYYFSALKKNTMAIAISNQFNKLLKLADTLESERIYFTRVLVAKYAKKYYMLEAFIEGEIEKYTNNFTFVNENVPLMSAFSHFSYDYTKGKYMVADLQGHNNLLTDPVIHSYNLEFPNQGDMGLKGMLAFFRYHQCNHYCKALHLGEHEAQNERADAILETPTKFDLKEDYQKCKFYYCNENSKHQKLCINCKKQVDPLESW